MIATIQLSPYIHIQGLVTRQLPTGDVAIAHAGREYVGKPLAAPRALA